MKELIMRSNEKPIIGLLLNTFFENYEMDIWEGIVDYAEEHNVHLICFVGGSLQSPYYHDEQRNAVYNLVSPDNVDGLISLSGSIAAISSSEELKAFYGRFGSLPVVSIDTATPGISCVTVDKAAGMEELMQHLAVEHQFRRIAFVRSRKNRPDTEVLFGIYTEALEKYGLTRDPALVIEVDPVLDDYSALLSYISGSGEKRPDAVVAADDYLALRLIAVLKANGCQVPQDIALVGFGNLDESRYLPQPLTTVRLPAYELGQKAMKMIMATLEGKTVEESISLPARMIKRRSCGCYLNKALSASLKTSSPGSANTEAEIKVFRESNITEIRNFMNDNFTRFRNRTMQESWAKMIVESLLDDLDNLMENRFLSTLENIVTKALTVDIEVLTWHKIVIELFTRLKQWVTDSEDDAFLDTLFKRSLEMIWEITVRSLSYIKIKAEEEDEKLFSLSQAFITAFNYKKLAEIIESELPAMGIRDCYISLYKEKDYDNANVVPVVAGNKPAAYTSFPAQQLISGGIRKLDKRINFIVMSLYYQDEQLGFVLFEIGKISANMYETLVVQISSTLKSIQMLHEVQKHTNMLEVKVKARTRDLHEANERLKQEIQRREETALILKKKNDEIEELNRKLEEKSKIDGLTRLYNREAFFNLFEKELQRTNRELWRIGDMAEKNRDIPEVAGKFTTNKPAGAFSDHIGTLTVMLIDIDHFKMINDTYGHVIGDDVLKSLGGLFKRRNILRREDFVGRFGGEEFVIVCPSTNSANAYELAKRLADEFSRIEFKSKTGTVFFVTLSIGISEFKLNDKDSLAVINRADKAMYYAKQNGRNQIAVYEQIFTQ